MKAVIDRFEADWAVLEVAGKIMWQVPRDFLPPGSKEGSRLEFHFAILEEKSEDELFKEIFE